MSETAPLVTPVTITGTILALLINQSVSFPIDKERSISALISGNFNGKEGTKKFSTTKNDKALIVTRIS